MRYLVDLEALNGCLELLASPSTINGEKTVYLKDGKAVSADGTMAGSTTFVSEIIKLLVKRRNLKQLSKNCLKKIFN